MSKSYDNAIYLSDIPEQFAKTVSRMITDPQRARKIIANKKRPVTLLPYSLTRSAAYFGFLALPKITS